MNIEKILGDYRNGDEDKRLGLFLGYRDLRDDFSSIDQDQNGFNSRSQRIPGSLPRKDSLLGSFVSIFLLQR